MSLRRAFLDQAQACEALGSPFMGQLLRALAAHWHSSLPLARVFEDMEGDLGPSGASLPLRLAGGLHALVLAGRDDDLASVYPPHAAGPEPLWPAVDAAMHRHAEFLESWCARPPQTNEVGRSAALIAAGHALANRFGLPLRLSELGASAGLNLMWDRYALSIGDSWLGPADPVLTLAPEWHGVSPPRADIEIAERAGVDLDPLDARNPDDAPRLLAYVWPDQADRLARTRAALEALAVQGAPVTRGDAIEWLEHRLARPWPGQLHIIFHTVAWQYFPQATQERGQALIAAAGAGATPRAPLAWLSMEADGKTPGAALRLRFWPGDSVHDLGRADFHGRWLRWQGLEPPARAV